MPVRGAARRTHRPRALVLSLTAIDVLGGLYRGGDATHATFGDFVRRFMPGYDAERTRRLRSKVLHQYAMPVDFVVMYAAHRADQHLKASPGFPTRTVLHVPSLAEDVDQGAERLFVKASSDPRLASLIVGAASRGLVTMGNV